MAHFNRYLLNSIGISYKDQGYGLPDGSLRADIPPTHTTIKQAIDDAAQYAKQRKDKP
jgi:hypothetical protein